MASTPNGHIERLPSGSWRAKVYAGRDPLTGREIRLRRTCKTERAAQIELGKLLKQATAGRQPETGATVAELMDKYALVADWDLSTRKVLAALRDEGLIVTTPAGVASSLPGIPRRVDRRATDARARFNANQQLSASRRRISLLACQPRQSTDCAPCSSVRACPLPWPPQAELPTRWPTWPVDISLWRSC